MGVKWTSIARRGSLRAWLLLLTLLGLLTVGACSHPSAILTDQTSTGGQQHPAPFQDQDSAMKADPAGSSESSPTKDNGIRAQSSLPFRDAQNLPAGTLLTVQLKTPVYASRSDSTTAFEAFVVEPVVVEGNTLIPSGTSVAGRVESARSSKLKPNRGYVRLALKTVQLGGLSVPVQTASLFAREAPFGDDPAPEIHLEKGRRLTFRLTETAYTSSPHTQMAH